MMRLKSEHALPRPTFAEPNALNAQAAHDGAIGDSMDGSGVVPSSDMHRGPTATSAPESYGES